MRNVKFVRKHRFVYRNTCKITVPAGLAWHAWGKSSNRYGEYDELTYVFDKFRKIKVRILNNRTHETWYLGFRDTYFTKTCNFWRKSRVFGWNRQFLIDFWHKTLVKHSTGVSDACGAWNSWKRRFVHQSTGKKTLPAGSAQHARTKNFISMLIIWNRVCAKHAFWKSRTYRTFMHKWIFNINSMCTLHLGTSPLETHP